MCGMQVSSKSKSERWKDQTETQRIYSGSATRTPSLPYSTPRVTYSRVFFTRSKTSFMAEKTVHTNNHNTPISQHTNITTHQYHTFDTPSSHQSSILFTPIFYTPIFYTLHTFNALMS
jgi:hypothetical protein